MSVGTRSPLETHSPYTHRALFYETTDELLRGLIPFVQEGLDADERVVVVVDSAVGSALREWFGTAEFDLFDSADLYTFPVHTLAAYVDTVRMGTEGGRRMRVAGEPIWVGRAELEVSEWTCIEAACNVVFADSPLTMLCPYDLSRLDPSVIDAARRTHPEIEHRETISRSRQFSAEGHQASVRSAALPPAPALHEELTLCSIDDCSALIEFVDAFASGVPAFGSRADDIRAAATSLAVAARDLDAWPSIMRVWTTGSDVVCELECPGSIESIFAGLLPPRMTGARTGALWSAGQECDVIAVRSLDGCTVVRLHFTFDTVQVRPACNGIDELLGVYALGCCEAAEVSAVEAHVVDCAECTVELERLQRVVATMNIADET